MRDEKQITYEEVKKSNIVLHDKEADIYEDIHNEIFNPVEQNFVKENLNKITSKIEKNICLDLGCGTGNITLKEINIFEKVVGLDISKEMIENIRNKQFEEEKLNLVISDSENLPFKSELFDFVSMFSVLHHLPDTRKTLNEIYYILKGRGLLYIDHEPNSTSWSKYFKILILKIKLKKKEISGLDYSVADFHAREGFRLKKLKKLFFDIGFNKFYTMYHFIIPYKITKNNEKLYSKLWKFIDNIPFFNRLSDCITIIAEK